RTAPALDAEDAGGADREAERLVLRRRAVGETGPAVAGGAGAIVASDQVHRAVGRAGGQCGEAGAREGVVDAVEADRRQAVGERGIELWIADRAEVVVVRGQVVPPGHAAAAAGDAGVRAQVQDEAV